MCDFAISCLVIVVCRTTNPAIDMSTTGHIYNDAEMGSSQGSVGGPQPEGDNRPITPVDPRVQSGISGHVDPFTVAALTAGSAYVDGSSTALMIVVLTQRVEGSGSELTISGAVSR